MESISSSSSSLQRSRVILLRPFLVSPSRTRNPPPNPLFVFFIFLFFSIFHSADSKRIFHSADSKVSDSTFESTYIRLCNHVVPLAVRLLTGTAAGIADSLRIQSGYFSGGDRLFSQSTGVNYTKLVLFRPESVYRTTNGGVCELRAEMLLQHRTPEGMRVSLNGFWSESSGELCMVGTGSHGDIEHYNVVLKLSYPRNPTISDSLIIGTLESFDNKNSSNYFDPISILALSQSSNYKFTLMDKHKENDCVAGSDGLSLPLTNSCAVFRGDADRFELEYGSHCNNVSCNPLGAGADLENLPDFMYFYGIRCSEREKVQMLLSFTDSSYDDIAFPFHPHTTLIAEGTWDENENRLCAVACRILNFTDSRVIPSVGDCSIKLTLRFPAILSLRNRSTVLGQIWSDKAIGESGYFSKIGFKGSSKTSRDLHGFQYEYTEIERVRKSCVDRMSVRGKGKMYPASYSFMRFSMSVRGGKGQVVHGYASPLFVGGRRYDELLYGAPNVLTRGELKAHMIQSEYYSNLLNVSYTMSFSTPPNFKFDGVVSSTEVEISAEGIYNSNTGILCMIGCRHLRSTDKKLIKNDLLDCEIKVNVQFSPLNADIGISVEGTLESTREKSDQYYFDPLHLSSSSIHWVPVKDSIWRMDVEIIMVLISNTIACVFVGLQLHHVKKHRDVLPYISVVMLIFIALARMISLVLNFEGIFMVNHSQRNVFLGSGRWFAVDVVVVRMLTTVALILELHLLHLTWSSRQGEGSLPGLWASEKMLLYMILPMYIGGGLAARFTHRWNNSPQTTPRLPKIPIKYQRNITRPRPSPLWEVKPYVGLLLDGFLLPQILFNVIFNVEGKALASSFYAGTTIVRILPHAYDLYRAQSSARFLGFSYIYANHRKGFYSKAWDIIIPCGGLLFAIIICLQQRFGSRCILPRRFRGSSACEKVPVNDND